MTIGLPQALFYYKHPHLWETFFKKLGFRVELSGPTNKDILKEGVRLTESETCLSCKVFYGHVANLVRSSFKLDYIFIPLYKSIKAGYKSCPKFFALAEVAKVVFVDLPPVLTPEINLTKEKLPETLYKFGLSLLKQLDKSQIKKAVIYALKAYEGYKKDLKKECFQKLKSKKSKIVLISHPYNLYDSFVNLNIIKKLEGLGVEVIPLNSVPYRGQKFYGGWDFMDEMIGQVKEVLPHICAGIQLSTFNCGCDSILIGLMEREFKKANIPYLSLVIDEHTQDTAAQTRLEAFVDTLQL